MAMLTRGQQRGYAVIIDPTMPGGGKEVDTVQCGHCYGTLWEDEVAGGNGGVVMRGNVRDTSGREALCGRCTCCGKEICLACVANGGSRNCTPLEKALEAMERRAEYDECSR